MENFELQFPQGFNNEAFERHGTFFGNFDYQQLKQEPINYQQYLNLQQDDDYPSNFSLLDQQLYSESNNYQIKINQEESISKSTSLGNQSSQEFEQISQEQMQKILQKARRQMHRERAKQKKLQKDAIKQEEDNKIQVKLEESIQCQQLSTDSKEQRKQQQQLRNRISAQQSRDKRKKYVTQLEEKQEYLQEKIKLLEQENDQLKGKSASKQVFSKDTAKIGFVVFSLMALMCSIQSQNHEVEPASIKEISFTNEKEKKIINQSQKIIIEESQIIKDTVEMNTKSEEEIHEESKNQQISNKPIRKQKKKRDNRKKQ